MPQFGALDYCFWALGFALRVYLLALVPRKYMPFYYYILAFLLRDFVLLSAVLSGPYSLYYYLYWSTAFLAGALNLWNGVYIFRESGKWLNAGERKLFRLGFQVLVAFSLIAALIVPLPHDNYLHHFVQIADRSASIILVGVYFSIFSLNAAFEISIHPRLHDIAAGFAIYKAIDLVRGALQVHYGPVPYLGQMGFLMALIWWLHAFQHKEPELTRPGAGEIERLSTMLKGFAERNTPHFVAGQKSMSGGE